jgi:hypothetical protein
MSTFTDYQKEIEEVCEKVRKTQSSTKVTALDGSEVYAYPRNRKSVAWGVNRASDGLNVLRGLRLPDGMDEVRY